MLLEVGKTYVTRDGKELVTIGYASPTRTQRFKVSEFSGDSWFRSGDHFDYAVNDRDLVMEWHGAGAGAAPAPAPVAGKVLIEYDLATGQVRVL